MKDDTDKTLEKIEATLKENEYPLPKAAPTLRTLGGHPPHAFPTCESERASPSLKDTLIKGKYQILGGGLVGLAVTQTLDFLWSIDRWWITAICGGVGYWVVCGSTAVWRKFKEKFRPS